MIVNWLGDKLALMYILNKTGGSKLELCGVNNVDLKTRREPTMEDIEAELKFYNGQPEMYSEYIQLLANILEEMYKSGEW